MPFTFSHPAIILPLKYFPRRWFSLTGLVIGSLTPDFEYFIRMRVQSTYSHTFYGIFWFDLPLALLLTFIFHNIIRNSLFINLPLFFQERLLIFNEFKWNNYFKENWITVVISILIGIISHLFWDAFTHNHGYFVNEILWLRNTIFILGNNIPIWKITQHLSSLIGAIVITFAFLKLPKNLPSQLLINKKYWITVITTMLLILILKFSISFNLKAFGNIIVATISAFLLSLILVPILIKSKVNSEI
ncbi:DUF4184 family protein [Flavobacterium aquidurense]|uniref:DUF4184 family protein n=1 Tax=Flavobacterium aquidurense TaxID=362413 RepID=UPI00286533DE|nr:DUF4184 family protein [Flavobacterium aquidurense]MDR7371970.1 uncharacterized membrane protein YvlD (DUF360 family) [Flavobacterium aquidurense]